MKFPTALLFLLMVPFAGAQTPLWKSDPAQATKLAAAVTIGGYSLQPPKGYSFRSMPGPNGSVAHAWFSEERDDGTRSWVMLGIVPQPRGEKPKTIGELCQTFANAMRKGKTQWKAGKPIMGSLPGLGMAFARIDWTAVQEEQGVRMGGFVLCGKDGTKFLMIQSQDVLPVGAKALKLAEATALTLRRAK